MIEKRQEIILLTLLTVSTLVFLKGLHESKNKSGVYKETPFLFPLGIFVWGDAVVFGIFWASSSIVILLLKDWYLFLLIVSVFWLVRGIGETIYWLNQQFSKINRNPPKKFLIYKIFKNDSIWFIHQITWQVITIVSIITTIYIANLWLSTLK